MRTDDQITGALAGLRQGVICRLRPGEVWQDPLAGHRVGLGDAADNRFVARLTGDSRVSLAVQDPPYNVAMFPRRTADEYIAWCRRWVDCTMAVLQPDASLYIWMGADQKRHFQPLPQFMIMMADRGLASRSLITMRNQRGYGTPHNWMAIRQELLFYTRGKPPFTVQYTDIPKILRGYYKTIGGHRTENLERSRSDCIRPGNVWVDIQQVFYRMQENIQCLRAQKPLKAMERIIQASSLSGDAVLDLFSHAGTTLLACERLGRRCFTADIDPVCVELTIRRLEHYRATGRTGWQHRDPLREDAGGSHPSADTSEPNRS
jgi:site-specific DNA-methyltransferase (adenine-specific)